ncbi:MAG: O-antigen ligase family protein [Bacteroidota bacterium]
MNRFDKIFFILLLTISLTISLPIRINAIVTVSAFTVFAILIVSLGNFSREFIKSPVFNLLAIQFILLLIGLLYTSDIEKGMSDVERSSFILAYLIISQYPLKKMTVSYLILAFAAGCFSITFYGLYYALFVLTGGQQKQVFELGHTYFADIILIHPLYLSIYFIFIFFFLLETARTKKLMLTNLSLAGIGVALISITGIIFFLRSQMSLITFAMLLVMYTIIILKRRAWLVTFILFTIALLVFLLDQNRVTTFFDTYGKNVSTALDQRFSVWQGTIEGIKTAPFFGAGTGGEQQLINEGYAKTGYQEGIDNSYNAHNQYLQFMARNGILELGCFLTLLIYSFRQSLKMPNYTFLMFNMSVTLIMFTESFLDVQRGIVFFYFFLCAFIYLPYESTTQPLKDV